MKQYWSHLALAALLSLGSAGCTEILGIDELSEGRPDAVPYLDAAPADAREGGGDPVDAALIDGFVQPACTPDLAPYDGVLCGPAGLPCRIQDDATIDGPAFRNDAPAVAVDGQCAPRIAFSVAESGYHGFYATIGGDRQWSAAETPFPIATVSAIADADGTPHLLAYDGSYGATLFSADPSETSGWVDAPIPEEVLATSGALARDADGAFYAGVRGKDNVVRRAKYVTTWQLTSMGETGSGPTRLALSPADIPQLAWWNAQDGEWRLRWKSQSGAVETVSTLGSGTLGSVSQRFGLAVSAPDAQNPAGRPHIVFARPRLDDTNVVDLIYVTRGGAADWDAAIVDDSESADPSYCNYQPTEIGETCEQRFDEIAPVGLVATPSGAVRIVYAKHHREATLTAQCEDGPGGGFCFFQVSDDRSTAELMIAWLDDELAVGRAVVDDFVLVTSGTVVLDAVGSLHLAVYGKLPDEDGTSVRYLRVGP